MAVLWPLLGRGNPNPPHRAAAIESPHILCRNANPGEPPNPNDQRSDHRRVHRRLKQLAAVGRADEGRPTPDRKALVLGLGDYITNYLSGSHRDMPGRGCPFAALSCEMPRQSSAMRERFTDGLRAIVKRLTSRMDSALKQRQRYEEALATVASLVGALVLARAVNDPKLSDDILRATRSRLKG